MNCYCGNVLKNQSKYCSRNCHWLDPNKKIRTGSMIEWICKQCGKLTSRYKSAKRYIPEFCGRSCANKWGHANGIRKTDLGKKQPYEYWIERFGKVTADKMFREQLQKIGIGKKGSYVSIKTNEENFYESNYELTRMKFLDGECSCIKWTKNHGLRIPYTIDDSKIHHYVPDFLVVWNSGLTTLEEVKGKVRDTEEFTAKNNAAKKYCDNMNWTFKVLWKNDLEK